MQFASSGEALTLGGDLLMSKFDLRDISERLTRSRNTQSVVFEFLRALEEFRSDWRVSLAFYEVSQDALVNVFEREGNRLVRREIVVPSDRLPPRLVRNLFHGSANFNHGEQPAVISRGFGPGHTYVADEREASDLLPLTVLSEWRSCVCLPLGDQGDLIGILVLVSGKRNAFAGRVLSEIMPIKSIACIALAQQLGRAARGAAPPPAADEGEGETQVYLRMLHQHTAQLEQENRAKSDSLQALATEIENLDKNSSTYRQELERVQEAVSALEEQTTAATVHLAQAFSECNMTQWESQELDTTLEFMKDVFVALRDAYEPGELPQAMVEWLCDRFGVERCSLMVPDASGEVLRMAAHCGLDPAIVDRIRVRFGQGIAGWVAHNRKPLFVRMREEVQGMPPAEESGYNSDSFIAVPLVHNGALCGVLNLSNKLGGEAFNENDLDRALLAASILAIHLTSHDQARRAAAWA
jgi:GAF domain-containing protein